jgi:peptidoglycan/xylan/chitin deacetylase (PgdA/CDA1 family)
MASLKSRLVRPVHDAALRSGLSGWRARRQDVRRIVMLHGVGPKDLPDDALDVCIGWLARHFRIVPLAELIDAHAARRPCDREIALTFDDGLRCHVERAYPVLLRHRAPATFFVCPGLIESRRWLWNHEARSRLERLVPAELTTLAARWGAPAGGVEAVVGWMKSLHTARRIDVEGRLREATPGFTPTREERERFDPLAWDDLARLDPSVVTIGSHTLMHPILPTLDDATLESELSDSRAMLENRLKRTVDIFCYPNGSTDRRVREAAARSYRAAVTTEYGNVHAGVGLLELPRIPVTSRLSLMAWRMHRPAA